MVKDASFTTSPDGIIVEGIVTVEGHTSVEGSISLSCTRIAITGMVEDIHHPQMFLPGGEGIVIKQAALDVFISRVEDTTTTGLGTSWRFVISGTVDIRSTTVSVYLYLEKDTDGKLQWTVFGSFSGPFHASEIEPETLSPRPRALSSTLVFKRRR